jgi:hypothetical protein
MTLEISKSGRSTQHLTFGLHCNSAFLLQITLESCNPVFNYPLLAIALDSIPCLALSIGSDAIFWMCSHCTVQICLPSKVEASTFS